ncbi:MAG: transporter substrate-binding domain-containing protein, partial [Methylophilaceae bacterium]
MRILFILFISLVLTGCEPPPAPLAKAVATKELVVVTHNGPNTYYVNGENEYAGLEYDLAKLFAKEFGPDYSIKFLVVDNITKVIPTLLKGQAHFAAADLSITELRQHLVQFTVPYENTQQQVVYNKELGTAPKSLEELIGKRIAVPAGTSYAERLREIKQQEPRLTWREPTNNSADELLEQVADGSLDYTVADAHLIALLQNYYPNLGAGMS